jgi:hypothetical protein
MTSIVVGAHPALSEYRTLNVMVVEGLPLPGVALPALRTGAACEAPLQLAAAAEGTVAGVSRTAVAHAMASTAAARMGKRPG